MRASANVHDQSFDLFHPKATLYHSAKLYQGMTCQYGTVMTQDEREKDSTLMTV